MNNHPYISIVIPAHNESTRCLRQTVETICRHMMARQPSFEIVIVENASTDDTWFVCRRLAETYRPVRIARIDIRSKAEAVKQGMLLARGNYRYMCDADLSTPITDLLTQFMPAAYAGADLVIGSRKDRKSKIKTSFKRWFVGEMFQLWVELNTDLIVKDTQCGFKLFTAQAANLIFPRVQIRSGAFDVEVLWLAQRMGFVTVEVPVTWVNDENSRFKLGSDSWQMARDVFELTVKHRRLPKVERVSQRSGT